MIGVYLYYQYAKAKFLKEVFLQSRAYRSLSYLLPQVQNNTKREERVE